MEDIDELANTKWFRGIVIAALLSGTGSGVVNFTKDASDRYKGQDAARDFAVRDARIRELETALHAHLLHSAVYTERIRDLENEHEELIEEVHAHQRGGMHKK